MLQQVVKRKAGQYKSFARQVLHDATHPGILSFAVASGLTLLGTLVLLSGMFEPLCRCAFALIDNVYGHLNPFQPRGAILRASTCQPFPDLPLNILPKILPKPISSD